VGETACEPARHGSMAALMAEADAAMYGQKKAGRGAE
jgi:GGDEF domain-containing protein